MYVVVRRVADEQKGDRERRVVVIEALPNVNPCMASASRDFLY